MKDPKVLLMLVWYGEQKDYVVEKSHEMFEHCVFPVPNVDVVVASDRPGYDCVLPPGLTYTDDIVTPARQWALDEAREGGYDKVIWQGIDALYQSERQFRALLAHNEPIISTVISARTQTDFACARRWVRVDGELTPCQDDIPVKELLSGDTIHAGWPSADTIMIDKSLFDLDVLKNYDPWYKRDYYSVEPLGDSQDPAAAKGRLASSEAFCYAALTERGVGAFIDTRLRTWHVHESGSPIDDGPLARLWPNTEYPMSAVRFGDDGLLRLKETTYGKVAPGADVAEPVTA